MKILFVNTQMSTGGIATSLVNLCENLKKYPDIEVDVLLLNQVNGDTRYNISDNIKILNVRNKYLELYTKSLKKISEYSNIVEKLNVLIMKVIRKVLGPENIIKLIFKSIPKIYGYDIAISYRNDEYHKDPYVIYGCNDFVLQCVSSRKKIAWIHSDLDRNGFTYSICKDKFKEFNYIVNVSAGCKDRFDKIIPEYKDKSKLVYNTFNYDEIINKSTEFNPYKNIDDNIIKLVTVGRINHEQKRMDRILEVCNKLREQHITNYIWYVVGDGPDAYKMQLDIDRLGLNENIILVGKKSNPFPYMKYADCLVMTSEYEAYGMTLVEALILETPIITTNHIAAEEIVSIGVNGYISENSSSGIEEKVKMILENPKKLELLNINIKNQNIDKNIALNQFLELVDFNPLNTQYNN